MESLSIQFEIRHLLITLRFKETPGFVVLQWKILAKFCTDPTNSVSEKLLHGIKLSFAIFYSLKTLKSFNIMELPRYCPIHFCNITSYPIIKDQIKNTILTLYYNLSHISIVLWWFLSSSVQLFPLIQIFFIFTLNGCKFSVLSYLTVLNYLYLPRNCLH